MKIQNIIRTQMMVMGFGAALMLAGAAQAQEIDNTVWNDTPTVAASTQPAPVPPAPAAAKNEEAFTATETGAITLAPANAERVVEQESSVAEWTPSENRLMASLVVVIGLVALYALAEAKRVKRIIEDREAARMNRSAALS